MTESGEVRGGDVMRGDGAYLDLAEFGKLNTDLEFAAAAVTRSWPESVVRAASAVALCRERRLCVSRGLREEWHRLRCGGGDGLGRGLGGVQGCGRGRDRDSIGRCHYFAPWPARKMNVR